QEVALKLHAVVQRRRRFWILDFGFWMAGNEQRQRAGMQVMADLEDELGVLGKGRRDELGDFGQIVILVVVGQRFGRMLLREFGGDFDAVLAERFDQDGAGE